MAPKPKTIQMSISGRLEREIAVYLYSAIMHNNEKKRAMTVYNSMAKSHKQNIEEIRLTNNNSPSCIIYSHP